MGVLTNNSYTGKVNVEGMVKVKTHDEADYLDDHFNGNKNYTQVTNITRGETYQVISKEGFGDCEDITVIGNDGTECTLMNSFFIDIDC